jgi:hypothetical protein
MPTAKRQRIHRCGCSDCQRHPYSISAQQHTAINRVLATLDERNRRRFVGLLAIQWGPRSIAPLSRITGCSRMTIRRGKYEIEHPLRKHKGHIREPGAGRLPVEKNSRTF